METQHIPMPRIPIHIETNQEIHMNTLWTNEECYRFYVQQRRLNCSYMDIMDLWLLVPYCVECISLVGFKADRLPDIQSFSWETDIKDELGEKRLMETKKAIQEDTYFSFKCKSCFAELRPWHGADLYVVEYHLEEHYGIPLETPDRQQVSRWLRNTIFKLYDYKCFGCNSANQELHIDHVVPQDKSGDAAFRNLQPLCEICGNRKGNMMPNEVIVTSDIDFDY